MSGRFRHLESYVYLCVRNEVQRVTLLPNTPRYNPCRIACTSEYNETSQIPTNDCKPWDLLPC